MIQPLKARLVTCLRRQLSLLASSLTMADNVRGAKVAMIHVHGVVYEHMSMYE